MAGIYIHIPFCKKKCHYCDFHFSTTFESYYDKMVDAICKEIVLQKDFFGETEINTLYFGGGTPSLLQSSDLKRIYQTVLDTFNCKIEEFTIEMNPDDMDEDLLKSYVEIGVNRLSIGIQSFDDEVLKLMNRAHNSNQSESCVALAKKVGIQNISIDLIYGIPNQNFEYWKSNVAQAIALDVNHISAYCLTIEENTVFSNWSKSNKIILPEDEAQFQQFHYLIEALSENSIEQYEVSNFAKLGWESKHNSSYWRGLPYLGIGPSAHSFNGKQRFWNVANNHKYINDIEQLIIPASSEELTIYDRFNELVLIGLRTRKGVSLDALESLLPLYKFEQVLNRLLKEQKLILDGRNVKIPTSKLFQADGIASELFVLH